MQARPLLLFLVLCLLAGCGLSRYGIREAWVFTEEKFSGNIQVDNDDGTPVTKGVMIETSIFLETNNTDLPKWTSAEINGRTYKIIEYTKVSSPFNVGKDKSTDAPLILTATTGNVLYRLAIEAFDPSKNEGSGNIRLMSEEKPGTPSLRITKKATKLLPQMIP